MEATHQGLAATGSSAPPREKEEGVGPSSGPERNPAGSSSIPEVPPPEASNTNAVPEAILPPVAASVEPAPLGPAPEASNTNAVPEAILPPVAASVEPAPLGPAPLDEAVPRSSPGPGGSRPGPETFRQRFRQFRYRDAAGPREAFRQLRELSRQWLRPDIRTKEQIVEMLVQEQLLAILPEAARARRLQRRCDVRITG